MIGKIKDLYRGLNGEWILSLSTPTDLREICDELKDKQIDFTLKKYRNGRSLDANAYCWALIGELAKRLSISKTEVYRKAIIDNGVYVIHCIPNDMLEASVEDWKSFGLGFQVETFPSKTEGCTNAIFYKGSSYYDTSQMHRRLAGIIQECEQNGIPTITPEEEKRLIGDWAKKRKENENAENNATGKSTSVSE